MRRIERLVAIRETLRRESPRPVTARRLAAEHRVSRRTIERDIASLREAGVPLRAEAGRNGGAVSLERVDDAVVALLPREVLALLLAVDAAGPSVPFAEDGAAALARMLDALPDTTRERVEDLRARTLVVTDATDDDVVRPAVRHSLETALHDGVVVDVAYRDGDGVASRRRVEPHGLLRRGDRWYLIGWCLRRGAGRLFRLDRVEAAQVTRLSRTDRAVHDVLGSIPGETQQL